MKTLAQATALFLLASVALLSACGARPPTRSDATALWTDPSTGCRYIVYRDGTGNYAVGSLSIRFKEDGTADCPGKRP